MSVVQGTINGNTDYDIYANYGSIHDIECITSGVTPTNKCTNKFNSMKKIVWFKLGVCTFIVVLLMIIFMIMTNIFFFNCSYDDKTECEQHMCKWTRDITGNSTNITSVYNHNCIVGDTMYNDRNNVFNTLIVMICFTIFIGASFIVYSWCIVYRE
jgi:uncharacterized membrane protein